jgi:hypothetical protein
MNSESKTTKPPRRMDDILIALCAEVGAANKGKPADPDDFRGVYRIGLPRSE